MQRLEGVTTGNALLLAESESTLFHGIHSWKLPLALPAHLISGSLTNLDVLYGAHPELKGDTLCNKHFDALKVPKSAFY
jgi:hypothetical protein